MNAPSIIFSDEAHFWLNGFVNKQNMRYWSATNPNALLETPLHPQKVTVWCGFHAGGVIGPYFFVDENDCHATVNESAIVLCWKIICGQNWMNLTLTICGLNKTVPLATQHASQSIHSKANSVKVLSREMVRSNGRLAHTI